MKYDWGYAYEEERRSVEETLRRLRSEGCRKWQYLPWLGRSIEVVELTDDEIRTVAQREAEKYTQRAQNQQV